MLTPLSSMITIIIFFICFMFMLFICHITYILYSIIDRKRALYYLKAPFRSNSMNYINSFTHKNSEDDFEIV